MSIGQTGQGAGQVLAARLKKLDRQARAAKLLGFLALLTALAALGLSAFLLTNKQLEATSLVLKGSSGEVLAQLGTTNEGVPGLSFFDPNRNTRAWLGLVADGSPRLVFGDVSGKPRVSLVLNSKDKEQAQFRLHDAQGEARATLGLTANGTPGLEFANDQGKAVFRVPPSAGATPQERWVNYNAAGSRAFIQGRMDDAEKLYVAAIGEAKTFGARDLRLAASMNNLGVLYVKQQNFGRAGELYRQALAIRESALGKEHPQVAQSLANMALLYHAQGQLKEAEPLYRKALAITETTLGPDSSALISPLTNYAELLRRLDRSKEAQELEVRIEALQNQDQEQDAAKTS